MGVTLVDGKRPWTSEVAMSELCSSYNPPVASVEFYFTTNPKQTTGGTGVVDGKRPWTIGVAGVELCSS